MSSLYTCLSRFSQILSDAAVDSPRLSAEILLAFCLNVDRSELLKQTLLRPDTPLSTACLKKTTALVHRRAAGEPVAYLTGEKEFYGRLFQLSKATLIPRPETELLLETALDDIARHGENRQHPYFFADIGTGSGCIAISLCAERSEISGFGLDLCPNALRVAQKNAQRYGIKRLIFFQADLFTAHFIPESLDLIVANPPYLSEAEYAALGREVKYFEPRTALVPCLSEAFQKKNAAFPSNSSGNEAITAIIGHAANALKPGGRLLLEIGWKQGPNALELLAAGPWSQGKVLPDLAGKDRVLSALKC